MATHVSDANFAELVLKADEPVLVDFWAPWCGPCLSIAPTLDQLSVELKGKVRIVKLNVDENPQTTGFFGINAIPAMLLFKAGDVADKKIGAGLSKTQLSNWLKGHAQ